MSERVPERRSTDKAAQQRDQKIVRRNRRDLILMAALLAAVIGITWFLNDRGSGALRDASVEACERQNEVRVAVRGDLHDDIANIEDAIERGRGITQKDFPNIAPERFRRLQRQGRRAQRALVDRKRGRRKELIPTDCEAEYPK